MGDGEGETGDADEPPEPLCRSPGAAAAATDLLWSLVHACVPNMAALAHLLDAMFYSGLLLIFQVKVSNTEVILLQT